MRYHSEDSLSDFRPLSLSHLYAKIWKDIKKKKYQECFIRGLPPLLKAYAPFPKLFLTSSSCHSGIGHKQDDNVLSMFLFAKNTVYIVF